MSGNMIKLRAHHGLCLAFFEGKGYSEGFTAHMERVSEDMKKNPLLKIVAEADVICESCPNLGDGVCRTAKKILRYDQKVLALCGLEENAEIRWNSFSALVEEKILNSGKRREICGDCEWDEICDAKLQDKETE